PDALRGLLRDLAFPKQMHWDAVLDDGRGELLFGRPIRWLLFLYGGRVVPFAIGRAAGAAGPSVQDVTSGAITYGHRFLATTGRPGRSIKVRTFDEYRARLPEHFVILEHEERRARIVRELEKKARKLGGRVTQRELAGLLDEVADLVEYPGVVAGFFARDFLELPHEVLTTTLVHHQHFFPVLDESGDLKEAFLAVVNTEPEEERVIARNAERVVTARLRDARFFWEADRKTRLDDRLARLDTIVFHKKAGTYRDKAERIERLARSIAVDAFGAPQHADAAARAARVAKADLATDMVFEFPELQGTMGGIYAREQGEPEAVWKAVYYHYLPIAAEADAPPSRAQLGGAAVTWAAVSLADKADTLAGLISIGERPTGSRDPFALRRAAQGIVKILVDLPEASGLDVPVTLGQVVSRAEEGFKGDTAATAALYGFLLERLRYVLEQRGFDQRNVRAVTHDEQILSLAPLTARRKLEVLPEFTGSAEFRQLATAFKRVRNIARDAPTNDAALLADATAGALRPRLKEPAELGLLDEIEQRERVIDSAIASADFRRAFGEAAKVGRAVDRFFTDVFVMVDDPALKLARLQLMKRLETLILRLADVSEITVEERQV
ncbi:MAG TPA: glycine--tRNA ligase subunit beta, partial [Vicinamibacterales bacterium]